MYKIVLSAVLMIILFAVSILAAAYIGNYNYGNSAEKTIVAAYDHNKNVLSNYTTKVAEIAQVPGMQRDDLTAVIEKALNARYGADGSKAVFQFIKEQNPNIDSAVYVKIQQVIEAGRNEFRIAQDQLIDKKRVYETNLGYLWTGFWLRVAGYPKIDLAKYSIIVDTGVSEKFETKQDSAIKLR